MHGACRTGGPIIGGAALLLLAFGAVAPAPFGGPAWADRAADRANGARVVQATPDPAILSVITTQLGAFRVGDRVTAYDQAAPFIRRKFPDADNFMDMVTRGYAPLIAPRATDFLPPEPGPDGRVVQPMALLDAEGRGWIARYTMERQADGGWKIAGCRLEKAPEAAA